MFVGHYLPIFLAALAAFLIGAVWYSPLLFAKAWVRVHGYTPEILAEMQKKAPKTYSASFIAFLVMAAVLHIILNHLGVESAQMGAAWGFHLWLGIAAPIGFTANLYSDKPLAAFLIDTGYQLVYLVAMGAILGGWH